MKTIDSLEHISDGNLYTLNDRPKADPKGCDGCSDCCCHVGDLVALTPFDVFQIRKHLNQDFNTLCEGYLNIQVENKLRIPYLKMTGDRSACAFLKDDGRCSIYALRPDICRLFPLGRVYSNGTYDYFLQIGACTKDKLEKIKIKHHLAIENYSQYRAFMLSWYDLNKALKFRLKFIRGLDQGLNNPELDAINDYFINVFYNFDVSKHHNFYEYYNSILPEAKSYLGIC